MLAVGWSVVVWWWMAGMRIVLCLLRADGRVRLNQVPRWQQQQPGGMW